MSTELQEWVGMLSTRDARLAWRWMTLQGVEGLEESLEGVADSAGLEAFLNGIRGQDEEDLRSALMAALEGPESSEEWVHPSWLKSPQQRPKRLKQREEIWFSERAPGGHLMWRPEGPWLPIHWVVAPTPRLKLAFERLAGLALGLTLGPLGDRQAKDIKSRLGTPLWESLKKSPSAKMDGTLLSDALRRRFVRAAKPGAPLSLRAEQVAEELWALAAGPRYAHEVQALGLRLPRSRGRRLHRFATKRLSAQPALREQARRLLRSQEFFAG